MSGARRARAAAWIGEVRRLLPLGALVSLAAAPLPARTVADVDQHLHALNGQRVLVHGWLVGCRLPRWWECGIADAPGDGGAAPHELRIDGDTRTIDHRLFGLSGAEVVVDAKADETCRVGICTDRGAVLFVSNIKIMKRGARL